MSRRTWAAASLLVATAVAGCAHYSTRAGLVGGIRSVAIPEAQNDTDEIDIGQRLADRMTDAFLTDGRLRVVDTETADAILQLRVRSIEDAPFTFTAAEVTQQYRFRVIVEGILERTRDGSQLLRLERVVGWGTYDAALPEEDGRESAVDRALEMVVEEVVDRTTASW